MARTTIYLNKDGEELLKKAKEYAPNYSLSEATVSGLKAYLDKMDALTKDMTEYILFEGDKDIHKEQLYGTRYKIIGKMIASTRIEIMDKVFKQADYRLFYTRKGNYVMDEVIDEGGGMFKSIIYKYYSLKDLQAGAPDELLMLAESTPGEFAEEMDI